MVRTSCLLSLLSGWVPIPGPGTKIPETMLCDQKKKKVSDLYSSRNTLYDTVHRLKSYMHFCLFSKVVLVILSLASLDWGFSAHP